MTLVILLLLCGAAVLGVLQVGWVTASSNAEEQRQRDFLERSTARAAADAEQDIRAILSLTRVEPSSFAARDWTQLLRGLHIWQTNAQFPALLGELYVLTRLRDGGVLRYDNESEILRPAALPAEIAEVIPETFVRTRPPWLWPSKAIAGMRRIVVQPLFTPASLGLEEPDGALVIVLDSNVFYTRIVPYYTALDIGDLPYRVTESGLGHVLAATKGLDIKGRRPDAVAVVTTMPLGDLGMQGVVADGAGPHAEIPSRAPRANMEAPPGPGVGRSTGAPAAQGPGAQGERTAGPDSDVDPLLQSWMQRSRGTPVDRPGVTQHTPPGSGEALLEVYSARGSLASTIRQQEALNIGISLSILVLLVASAFVLSQLYLRSAAMRASEQGFVASMSHELRTPISVIQATSENLSRGVVSEPGRVARYAEVIYGQIKRLSGMVEGILIYSGLQSGKPWVPSIADVDLRALVDEVTQPLRYLAASQGSALIVGTDGMPPVIQSDRVSLCVIVENLVMNAIRHARPGEIHLTVAAVGGKLRIVVEDSGPGIPAREQRRVFEPFVRGERSVKEQKPGSGLGLHLVRRVSQLLEGSVVLESPYRREDGIPQTGCRFVVLLPLREGPHGE